MTKNRTPRIKFQCAAPKDAEDPFNKKLMNAAINLQKLPY